MKNRKERWMSAGAAACCLLCLLPSCAKQTKIEEGEDFVYCINGEGTGLFKVVCDISQETPDDGAEAALEKMASPSEDIEYMPAIPENVKVKSLKVEHDIAYIDFNKKYNEIPSIEEKLVRAAVVQTLVRLDGINGVWITVEEENLKNESGKVLGVLNGDDFAESAGSSPSAYEQTTLTLFFANESGDQLVRQQMDVRYNTNVPREKMIVEKLMGGPKKSGAYPTLNPSAALLGVTVKEGTCYVNFDSEFLNSVYDVRPEVAIYSLVNSLLEGTGAGSVQIMVNGEKNASYQETVDLSQPLERDLSWEEEKEEE